jgi:hypothetical protein
MTAEASLGSNTVFSPRSFLGLVDEGGGFVLLWLNLRMLKRLLKADPEPLLSDQLDLESTRSCTLL